MNLNEVLELLEEDSLESKNTINTIVNSYTKDLDKLVNSINNTLIKIKVGELTEYPFKELELDFALLTTEIYKSNSVLAELGGTSDIAKSKRHIAFSKAYLDSTGNTIKEKEADANIRTKIDLLVENIYDRVIKQIRLKTENADSVHMALKRMHSARLTEMEVFRGEELKGGKSYD